MTLRHFVAGRAAVLAAALACGGAASAGPPPPQAPVAPSGASSASEPVSEAERLLFLHPHLAAIRTPTTLNYAWSVQGAASAGPSERASLALRPRSDGTCCTVHAEALPADMAIPLPDFDDATANPIVLYFLEAEVRRLQRSTTGQSAHFRRQIRMALATRAKVTDEVVRWDGKELPAHAVRVAPFLDDPYRPRFEREAATEYVFVVSDGVPGSVAAMTATLPGPDPATAPLERRRLVLEDPQPAPPGQP